MSPFQLRRSVGVLRPRVVQQDHGADGERGRAGRDVTARRYRPARYRPVRHYRPARADLRPGGGGQVALAGGEE